MRIVAWNCNMRFRDKIDVIMDLSAQLAVISECENTEKLRESKYFPEICGSIWIGDNSNKGIGIFSFSDIKIEIASWYNSDFKYIIPIHAKSKSDSYLLFAIWACNPPKSKFGYIEQVYQAINHYSRHIDLTNVLVIGDFNSNTIWDKKHSKHGSHSMVVDFLKQRKIVSSYHTFYKEEHGQETAPTLYMYRHINRPYHVDYCFISENLYDKLAKVQIGLTCTYLKHSDHMPITLEFIKDQQI